MRKATLRERRIRRSRRTRNGTLFLDVAEHDELLGVAQPRLSEETPISARWRT